VFVSLDISTKLTNCLFDADRNQRLIWNTFLILKVSHIYTLCVSYSFKQTDQIW